MKSLLVLYVSLLSILQIATALPTIPAMNEASELVKRNSVSLLIDSKILGCIVY